VLEDQRMSLLVHRGWHSRKHDAGGANKKEDAASAPAPAAAAIPFAVVFQAGSLGVNLQGQGQAAASMFV
jgi:hypothetical protein